MKLFECNCCSQLVYFENTTCERCEHRLGFYPEKFQLLTLVPKEDHWKALNGSDKKFRFCANEEYDACNWLIDADEDSEYCEACRFNRTVPDLGDAEKLHLWRKIEIAKHRLIYSLMKFRLPLIDKDQDPKKGLAFDFLADTEDRKIMSGHANGLITLNIAEADSVDREKARTSMDESYRTLLGHFRHEIAHYYWDVLVSNQKWLDPFHKLFGDETADYKEALEAHYKNGPPADWNNRFVSAYASSHPWEDWAESWAHYLHLIDTLETAHAFGLRIRPRVGDEEHQGTADFDPYHRKDFDELIDAWLPLTYAVNSLNRSMGQPDLYPFVLPPEVMEKMRFIHRLIREVGVA
ncbi:MAG: zinc-binding metallopeptidase family protein [Methyloligellaceae bacterium]